MEIKIDNLRYNISENQLPNWFNKITQVSIPVIPGFRKKTVKTPLFALFHNKENIDTDVVSFSKVTDTILISSEDQQFVRFHFKTVDDAKSAAIVIGLLTLRQLRNENCFIRLMSQS